MYIADRKGTETMKAGSKSLVYITGGSSGIGLALAKQLAREGASLVIIARNQEKLDAAEKELTQLIAPGQKVVTAALDVGDFTMLKENMDDLCRNYGVPDLLITSAGIGNAKTFLDTSAEEADQMMRINYAGTRDTIKCVLPHMLESGAGKILMVSSMAGLLGVYGYSAYSATKHALMGFAASLRAEMAQSAIQVSVICPSETETPILEMEKDTLPEATRRIKDLTGRFQPEDVAAYALRKLQRGDYLIIPGVRARMIYRMSRWTPGMSMKSTDLFTRLTTSP